MGNKENPRTGLFRSLVQKGKDEPDILTALGKELQIRDEKIAAREIIQVVEDAFGAVTIKERGKDQLPLRRKDLISATQLFVAIAHLVSKFDSQDISVSLQEREKANQLSATFAELKRNFQAPAGVGSAEIIHDFERVFFNADPVSPGVIEQMKNKDVVQIPKVPVKTSNTELEAARIRNAKHMEDQAAALFDDDTTPLGGKHIIGKSFGEISDRIIEALQLQDEFQKMDQQTRHEVLKKTITNGKALWLLGIGNRAVLQDRVRNVRAKEYIQAIDGWYAQLLKGFFGGESAVPDFSQEKIQKIFSLAQINGGDELQSKDPERTQRTRMVSRLLQEVYDSTIFNSASFIKEARSTLSQPMLRMVSSAKPEEGSNFAQSVDQSIFWRILQNRFIISAFSKEETIPEFVTTELLRLDSHLTILGGDNFSRLDALNKENNLASSSKEYRSELIAAHDYAKSVKEDLVSQPPETIPTGTLLHPRIYIYKSKQNDALSKIFGEDTNFVFYGANDPTKPSEAVVHFMILSESEKTHIYGSIDVSTFQTDIWVPASKQKDFPLTSAYITGCALSLYGDLARRKTVADAELVAKVKEQHEALPLQTDETKSMDAAIPVPTILELRYQEGANKPVIGYPEGTTRDISFRPTTTLTTRGRGVLEARLQVQRLQATGAPQESIDLALEKYGRLFESVAVANEERIKMLRLDPEHYYVEEDLRGTGIRKRIQTFRSGGEKTIHAARVTENVRRTQVNPRHASLFSKMNDLVLQQRG